MKVFLDANILFAASKPDSVTARLIRLLIDQGAAMTCDYTYEEARRNVELKWPARAGDLAALMSAIEIVPTQRFSLPVQLAEKDAPVLCAAIRFGCDYLVTGDKHDFGHLYGQKVEGVTVIALLRLAEILKNEH